MLASIKASAVSDCALFFFQELEDFSHSVLLFHFFLRIMFHVLFEKDQLLYNFVICCFKHIIYTYL